jgi:predicted nuclease with TOPRIM domain
MPQKQQHGAGFLDFMNSDPKKKIETNTKKIEELEKDSETKCDAIKKANDEKIKSLTDENAKLQAQVDAKYNEKPTESITSRFSNLFSFGKSASDAEAKASDAEVKSVDAEVKAPEGDVNPVVGKRFFGGRKSKKQNRKAAASKSKRRKSNKK